MSWRNTQTLGDSRPAERVSFGKLKLAVLNVDVLQQGGDQVPQLSFRAEASYCRIHDGVDHQHQCHDVITTTAAAALSPSQKPESL